MTQIHLNNFHVLYVHQDRLDKLNLHDFAAREHRRAIFGSFTHHHQQSQAFPFQQRVYLYPSLLVLYCQQPQVLHIANLDIDKLVVVFANKHPREWLFLAYSPNNFILLSLFFFFSPLTRYFFVHLFMLYYT